MGAVLPIKEQQPGRTGDDTAGERPQARKGKRMIKRKGRGPEREVSKKISKVTTRNHEGPSKIGPIPMEKNG